jgi:hypothetical protein
VSFAISFKCFVSSLLGQSLIDVWCIGGINRYYRLSDDSNYGPSVKFYVPASLITVVSHLDDHSIHQSSGTSLAVSHVAAVLAHFISYEDLQSNYPKVKERLDDNYQWNLILRLEGTSSHNNLVNTGIHNPAKPPDSPYDNRDP